jgi:hypothetical protein
MEVNKKMLQRKITVNSLLVFVLLFWASTALAVPAATVTHLSGPLVCHSSSGATRSLTVGSKIESGETVETAKRTYARLKFTDGSDVTMKPGTRLQVEKYAYDKDKPREDAGSFNLLKGGLRTVTGQIGKRGNQDSYRMKSPTATIGIRGTVYDVQFCQDGSQDSSCGSMPPGLYLAVANGTVVITNSEGVQTTLEVKAGQYVYVKNSTTPPVVLPNRPDIPFNPPPSVGSGAAGGSGEGC